MASHTPEVDATPALQTSFPKHRIRVVLLEGVHDAAVEAFEHEGFQVERHKGSVDDATLREIAADAHLLGIRSKTQVQRECFDVQRRLLAVGAFCIGTNQVDLHAAKMSGVPVFNSPFSNTRSVAELTIAEIVALHRRLFDRSAQMHAGQWRKSAAGAHEVRGRVLGIIGYGRIGSQVSVLAEAMGMHVRYFDVRPVLALGNARPTGSLHELLSMSDVVSLHVPATPQTANMIGSAELEAMRPGAFLINNARGSVVDLESLAETLRAGRLGGAAVDVYPSEPAGREEPFDCPLCGATNVILTPHIGGSTEEAQESIARDVASKLIRFVNNGSTSGAVNVPEVDLPEQPQPGPGEAQADVRPHRILHFHHNVPGVLSTMHRIISDVGANVSAEYLRTDPDVGYVVLDVDPLDTESVTQRLREVPETIRTRILW